MTNFHCVQNQVLVLRILNVGTVQTCPYIIILTPPLPAGGYHINTMVQYDHVPKQVVLFTSLAAQHLYWHFLQKINSFKK